MLPPGWFIRSNKPVDFPPDGRPSLTRPWFAVRTAITGARSGEAWRKDVALIVEVAQSSLPEDRAMVGIYGPGGIPVYWIVNLVDRQVEVYTGPAPGRLRDAR